MDKEQAVESFEGVSMAGLVTMVRMKTGMGQEQLAKQLDLPLCRVASLEGGFEPGSDILRSTLEGMLAGKG